MKGVLSVNNEIDRSGLKRRVIEGFSRLAEANISDVIKLIFAEKVNTASVGKMDLHAVASIKKVKDGVEIGLYNRFEALEKLLEISGERDTAEDFLRALSGTSPEGEPPED